MKDAVSLQNIWSLNGALSWADRSVRKSVLKQRKSSGVSDRDIWNFYFFQHFLEKQILEAVVSGEIIASQRPTKAAQSALELISEHSEILQNIYKAFYPDETYREDEENEVVVYKDHNPDLWEPALRAKSIESEVLDIFWGSVLPALAKKSSESFKTYKIPKASRTTGLAKEDYANPAWFYIKVLDSALIWFQNGHSYPIMPIDFEDNPESDNVTDTLDSPLTIALWSTALAEMRVGLISSALMWETPALAKKPEFIKLRERGMKVYRAYGQHLWD
jgi:hypothetical protein